MDLVRLPERVREVIKSLVRDLSERETVLGVGMFGSWSRGDAVPSSDVDVVIVDGREFDYEYVERIESGGLLVDLNYIPRKWITGSVPPEIDQKLFEAKVSYDRDRSLTNVKNWMSKTFWRFERVDLRTETYLIESDMYLSRASSAHAKGDFQSACVFAGVGMESILKILIEVNQFPISNSRFIEAVGESAEAVEMPELIADYLVTARLSDVNRRDAEKKLNLFKDAWEDVASFMKEHASTLDSLHFKIKTKLQYYGNPVFLEGMTARSQALMNIRTRAEAPHYMIHTLTELLENYAWLASAVEGVKLDYTILLRSLRDFKKSPTRVYKTAVEALNVESVSQKEAKKAVECAKGTILAVRRQRKELIKKFVKPPAQVP